MFLFFSWNFLYIFERLRCFFFPSVSFFSTCRGGGAGVSSSVIKSATSVWSKATLLSQMKPSLRVIIVFPCFQIVYSSLPWWSWRNCCVFVFQGTLYLYRRLRMSKLVSSRSYRSYKPSNFQHQQQRRVFVVSQKLCLRLHWPGEEHYLFCLGEGRHQRRRHTSKCSLFLLSLSPNNLFIWGQNGCDEEEPSGSRVCSLRTAISKSRL